jgi:hypothetical protein
MLDDDGRTYHMWAARMTAHCGIGSWLSNSEIVHAVADAPTGQFSVTGVVWPVWAHEPSVARAPTGEYLMHWTGEPGGGVLPVRGGAPCTTCVDGSSPPSCHTGRNWSVPLPTYMSWTLTPSDDASWSAPALVPSVQPLIDTNLAGVILANGSFVGLWRDNSGRTPGPSALHSVFARDWRDAASYEEDSDYKLRGVEDPTVWVDRRGGLHALTHSGCDGIHGFSDDFGRSWTQAASPAFGGAVALVGGGSLGCRRRERPHAVLGAAGELVALTSAFEPTGGAGGEFGDRTFTVSVPVATGSSGN